ncbi:MAG: hypothetical protein KKB30_17210 [Proteobacteria bacterium]|nr:hypothetical protein [Pseudomonadota bacterium]MBU1691097.1 hypothetical protein [Gammaproteobacteria bacterium]
MKIPALSIIVYGFLVSCCILSAETGAVATNDALQKTIGDIGLTAAKGDREGFAQKADKLLQDMKGRRVELCQQILVFMTIKHEALPQQVGWSILALYKYMNFTSDEKVAAVVPLVTEGAMTLDGPGNERLGRSILREVDRPHGLKASADFGPYTRFLKTSSEQNRPAWLLAYMFNQEPLEAVSSMARVDLSNTEAESLVQTIMSLPNEKTTLQTLADRSEWWAHLYVAEIMKKNPRLRDTEILKRLEKDDHPLVREALSEIKSGQGQSK